MGGGSEPVTGLCVSWVVTCRVPSVLCHSVFLKNTPVHVNASVLGFSKQCAQDLISTPLDVIWSPLSCH